MRDPKDKPSMWNVIKAAIGKDLTRFCMPVHFNEPMSMLQKISEIIEYEDLCVQANRSDDSVFRIAKIAAFCAAQYKSSDNRTNKPFNPLLGETFEIAHPKFYYISE